MSEDGTQSMIGITINTHTLAHAMSRARLHTYTPISASARKWLHAFARTEAVRVWNRDRIEHGDAPCSHSPTQNRMNRPETRMRKRHILHRNIGAAHALKKARPSVLLSPTELALHPPEEKTFSRQCSRTRRKEPKESIANEWTHDVVCNYNPALCRPAGGVHLGLFYTDEMKTETSILCKLN